MLDFQYTQAQQALLTEYLTQNTNALSYSACQGYLFAVTCSPVGVEVEQWLTVVCGGDDAIQEQHVFALMALHHQISDAVFNNQYQLPVLLSDYQDRQAWSQGFLLGIEHFYEALVQAEQLPADLRQALITATEQLGFFALELSQVAAFCQQNALQLDEFCKQQAELASEFAVAYAQMIEQVAMASGLFDEEA